MSIAQPFPPIKDARSLANFCFRFSAMSDSRPPVPASQPDPLAAAASLPPVSPSRDSAPSATDPMAEYRKLEARVRASAAVREVWARELPVRGMAVRHLIEDVLRLQLARDCGESLTVAELDALTAWDGCAAALADVRREGEAR